MRSVGGRGRGEDEIQADLEPPFVIASGEPGWWYPARMVCYARNGGIFTHRSPRRLIRNPDRLALSVPS